MSLPKCGSLVPNDVLLLHIWNVSQWLAATEPANAVSTSPRMMSTGRRIGRERLAVPERRVVAPHRHGVGPEAPREVDVADDEQAEDQAEHQEQRRPG